MEELNTMNRWIVPLGFVLAAVVSVALWWNLPLLGPIGEQMKQGGYLVAALIMLIILQTAFITERLWSLKKAQGRGSLPEFLTAIHTPILFGRAGREMVVSAKAQRRAARLLPNCTLVEMPLSKHDPFLETDAIRDYWLSRLDKFIAERLAKTAPPGKAAH